MARQQSSTPRARTKHSRTNSQDQANFAKLVELIGDLAARMDVMERKGAKIGSPESVIESAGRFENDPIFAEVVEFGRKYRQKMNRRSLAKRSSK